ncbi:transposase [Streptomyces chartreusis]|uniref:transposase n=1 Tax=Streptomyces chartreusis TaxID=1969 RepID=UPI00399A64B0
MGVTGFGCRLRFEKWGTGFHLIRAFPRSLIARGLSCVQLVISDAHAGLVDAIGAVLPGASWQRCRTHYARNLLCQVPKPAQPWVATLLRTVFEQRDSEAVQAQIRHVLDAWRPSFPGPPNTSRPPSTSCWHSPPSLDQIWSNNPQELNEEIRRRADVVGIFPDRSAWSARYWPSRTTSGPRHAATWASTCWPKAAPTRSSQKPTRPSCPPNSPHGRKTRSPSGCRYTTQADLPSDVCRQLVMSLGRTR